MLTRRALTSAVIAALLVCGLLGTASTVFAETPVGCVLGKCGVGAADPGKPGGGGDGLQPVVDDDGGAAAAPPPTGPFGVPCTWVTFDPRPAAGSPLWEGNDPATGEVQWYSCGGDIAVERTRTRFAPAGTPAGPPPPTPAELAQQAYEQLPIPNPSMHFGPNDQQIAVRYWLYLWTDDPGEISRTVTAGAVSVTATAKLTSVTWGMGAPPSVDQLGWRGETVECAGAGKPAPPDADVVNDPRPAGYCAYMYQVRSTPDRTGGSGAWSVTASATWTISWTSNTGETGTITAPPFTSATGVCVGAWSTVMVADGYTPQNGRCDA